MPEQIKPKTKPLASGIGYPDANNLFQPVEAEQPATQPMQAMPETVAPTPDVTSIDNPETSSAPAVTNAGDADKMGQKIQQTTKPKGIDINNLQQIADMYKPDNIDPERWNSLYKAVLLQESADPDTKEANYGKLPKGKRAYGMTQITPATAKAMGFTEEEIKSDPYANFAAGVKYLSENYKKIRANKNVKDDEHGLLATAASYFTGDTRVLKNLDEGGDGIPDVDDGKINARDYVKQIRDRMYPDIERIRKNEQAQAIKVEDTYQSAQSNANADAGGVSVVQGGSGSTQQPDVNTPSNAPVLQQGEVKKQTFEDKVLTADRAVRESLGLKTPATYPHRIGGNTEVLIPFRNDGGIDSDAVSDAITDSLTGAPGTGAKFRQAVGENPGQFANEITQKWLQNQIQQGLAQVVTDPNNPNLKFIKANIPVQNYVKSRIDAFATGGAKGVEEATGQMRREIGENERLFAEEQYNGSIQEAQQAAAQAKTPEEKQQYLAEAARLQQELDAKYPTSWYSGDELWRGIKRGLAGTFSNYQQLGLNLKNLGEAVLQTNDKQAIAASTKRDKEFQQLKSALQSSTPEARTVIGDLADVVTGAATFDAPVYAVGGAVLGPSGLIYTTALRSADKDLDTFVGDIAAALIELPIGAVGKALAPKLINAHNLEKAVEGGFKGKIGSADYFKGKLLEMGFGGLGEVGGDATVDFLAGRAFDAKNALRNFVAGAAFESTNTPEVEQGGGRGMQRLELRSPIGVSMDENGQPKFQGVVKIGDKIGLIQLDKNDPLVVKYTAEVAKGNLKFMSMNPDEFDQALKDFKGDGVVKGAMTPDEVRTFLEAQPKPTIEVKTNDSEVRQGVPSEERVGKESVQAGNVEVESGAKTETSRVVQTPRQQEVEQEVKPKEGQREVTYNRQQVIFDEDLAKKFDEARAAQKSSSERAEQFSGGDTRVSNGIRRRAGQKMTDTYRELVEEQRKRDKVTAKLAEIGKPVSKPASIEAPKKQVTKPATEESVTDEQALSRAYGKLNTTNSDIVKETIRDANRRFVKKLTPEERAKAEAAYDKLKSLTPQESKALSDVIGEGFFAPVKEPTKESPSYSRAVQDIKNEQQDFETIQLDANLKAGFEEIAKMQKEKATEPVETEDGEILSEQEREEQAKQFKEDQKSIIKGTKKIKTQGIEITLPNDLAARYDQTVQDEKTAVSKLKGTLDEQIKQRREISKQKKQAQQRIINEYKARQEQQFEKGFLKTNGRQVSIVSKTEDTVTIKTEDGTREIDRDEIETAKERDIKGKKAKVPLSIRASRLFGAFRGDKPVSISSKGTIYINDAAYSLVAETVDYDRSRGLTMNKKIVPAYAEKLRKAGQTTLANQLEAQYKKTGNVALVNVDEEGFETAIPHEGIHQVALGQFLSQGKIEELMSDNGSIKKMFDEITSKTGLENNPLAKLDPESIIQEVLAYGLTGDYETLLITPETLYDATLDVVQAFIEEFPKLSENELADLALVNYEAIRTEAQRRIDENKAGANQTSKEQVRGGGETFAEQQARRGKTRTALSDEQLNQIDNFLKTGGTLQAVRINTESFKTWFGDSKVVDENGNPMVVYHGSPASFDVFKFSMDSGFHFGTQKAATDILKAKPVEMGQSTIIADELYLPEVSQKLRDAGYDIPSFKDADSLNSYLWKYVRENRKDTYKIEEIQNKARQLAQQQAVERGIDLKPGSNVMPVYLQMSNPFYMEDTSLGGMFSARDDYIDSLQEKGILTKEEANHLKDDLFMLDPKDKDESQAILRNAFERNGYDGIIYTNKLEDAGSQSYVVFRPSQIKSAIGNKGTFDKKQNSVLQATIMLGTKELSAKQKKKIEDAPPYQIPYSKETDDSLVDLRDLGLDKKVGPMISGNQGEPVNMTVPIDKLKFGRDSLKKKRLLQADKLLKDNFTDEMVTSLRGTQLEDGTVVLDTDGNHRLAVLLMRGYKGSLPVKAYVNTKYAEKVAKKAAKVNVNTQQATVEKQAATPPSTDQMQIDNRLQGIANGYNQEAGLPEYSVGKYHNFKPEVYRQIADLAESLPHEPNNPEVQKMYKALSEETIAQYKYLEGQGVKFDPWLIEGQPYANSAEMRADVQKNNHLYFFIGGDMPLDHPMARQTDIQIGGYNLTVNDVFRAVHDYFGHAVNGAQFGARGEFNASDSHARMFSKEALPAMIGETIWQNAWVNYGQHIRRADGSIPVKGDSDFVDPGKRPFAAQKAMNITPDMVDLWLGAYKDVPTELMENASDDEATIQTALRKPTTEWKKADVKAVIRSGKFAVLSGNTAEGGASPRGELKTQALRRELEKMGYRVFDAEGLYTPYGEPTTSEPSLFVVLENPQDVSNLLRLGARYKQAQVFVGNKGEYRAPFTIKTPFGKPGTETYSKSGNVLFGTDAEEQVGKSRIDVNGARVTFSVPDAFTETRKQLKDEIDEVKRMRNAYLRSFNARAEITSADLLDWLGGRERKPMSTMKVAEFLEDTTERFFGQVPDPEKMTKEEYDASRVRRAVRDGISFIKAFRKGKSEQASGQSWYADSIRNMHQKTGEAFPEVMDVPQLRALFDVTLAITSQGNDVTTNYNYAVKAWRQVIEEFGLGTATIDGKILPTKQKSGKGYGRTGGQLEKFNNLSKGLIPVDSVMKKQLEKEGRLGELVETKEFKGDSGATQNYIKDAELQSYIDKYGAIGGVFEYLLQPAKESGDPYRATEILGPKIGAFFLNIAGFSQLVTVDMWAARWFYRLNGGLVTEKKGKAAIQDAPRNQSEGDLIRGSMQAIADEWNKNHENKLSPADVQAMLWYGEKDIWHKAGAKDSGQSDFFMAAERKIPEVVADMDGVEKERQRVVDNFVADAPDQGDQAAQIGTVKATEANKQFFIRQMATPGRLGLAATSKKQTTNKKLLNFDANEWNRQAERAKGSSLDTTESNELYRLLGNGYRAVTQDEKNNAIEGLSNYLNTLSKQTMGQFIVTVRRAGLLSGIKTFSRNILSNLAFQLLDEARRGTAGPMDIMMNSLSSNKQRQVQGISPRGMWYATKKGFTKGFKAFYDTIKKGDTGASYETFNLGYDPKSGYKWLDATVGNYAKYIFRLQGAGDALFRTYAYHRSLYEIAALSQKNGGRKIQDVLTNPTQDESDMAWRVAEFMVFQNDNALNTGYQRWKSKQSGLVKFIADYELPFVKTGSNIFISAMDYAVLGGVVRTADMLKDTKIAPGLPAWKAAKLKMWEAIDTPESRKVIVDAFSKGLTGVGIATIGYFLAKAGYLLGADDDDEKERNRRQAMGAGAGHMKIAGYWHDIRALAPFSSILIAGATAYRAETKELKEENKRYQGFVNIVQGMVLDMLPGARNFNEALDTKNAGSFVERAVGMDSIIPTIVSEVAQAKDTVQRETKADTFLGGQLNRIKAKIPGLRETLPEKEDVFGRPLPQPIGFNPIASKKAINDKAVEEAASVGWSMAGVDRKTDKKTKEKESVEKYEERKSKTQTLIKRAFDLAVVDKEYPKDEPKEDRKQIFDNLATYARQQVKKNRTISDEALKEIVGKVLEKRAKIEEFEDNPDYTEKKQKSKKSKISKKFNHKIEEISEDEE